MARVLATARGAYELTIDGRPVGDEVLAPGWTAYEWRLAYQVHDVTDLVRVVKIVQDDGSVHLVSTDDRWDAQTCEITESSLYDGQRIDGRRSSGTTAGGSSP